jgi:PAS domain S-box-containing protein
MAPGVFYYRHKKNIYAVLAGFFALGFAKYGISINVENITLNLVWSVTLPLLISLAYGPRHGLLAGLSGGAWYPFLLWPSNGYANLITTFILMGLFWLSGFINPEKQGYSFRKFLLRFSIVAFCYLAVLVLGYNFLFNRFLEWNPSFWTIKEYVNYINPRILIDFTLKDTIAYFITIMVAELLLHLPIIRIILGLPFRNNFALNTGVLLNSLITASAIFIFLIVLENILFNFPFPDKLRLYSLFALMLIWSTIIVARNMMSLFEKRYEAENHLRQKEQEFRVIFESIHSGIAITDPDGNFRFFNKWWKNKLGYQPYELYEMNFNDLSYPDDITVAESSLNQLLKGEIDSFSYEKRFQRRNKEFFWGEVFVSGIKDEFGKIDYIANVINDISERKMNQILQQQVELAGKNAEFKQKFLANMSHEIRTPLTGIIGMAEILSKSPLSETQHDYLNSLKQSGENLREVINSILDYSKIEAGKLLLKNQDIDISKLISDTTGFFTSIAHQRLEWKVEAAPDIPGFIYADRGRINQIIRNLISNAVKFTETGTITFRLINRNENQYRYLRIEIEDTGGGIPESAHTKIFHPFFQAENDMTRKHDGTGLGLAICKEIAVLLGGEIGFNSKEGKGSLFWFTIPYKDLPADKTSTETDVLSGEIPSLKILLVEDKQINQKVISLLLGSQGHNITTASNGQDALEIYASDTFDLVLMDIQMPVMDGITATKFLRAKYRKLPPIVGLSANAFEGDREKYILQGLDEYLTKPLDMDEFNRLIRKFLLHSAV